MFLPGPLPAQRRGPSLRAASGRCGGGSGGGQESSLTGERDRTPAAFKRPIEGPRGFQPRGPFLFPARAGEEEVMEMKMCPACGRLVEVLRKAYGEGPG